MSEDATIEPGTEVYDEHGRAWRYIFRLPDGALADLSFLEDRAHQVAREIGRIWTEPPTRKLEAKHAEVQEQLSLAEERLETINAELTSAARRLQALAARSAAVARLEDFMEGRISHIVTSAYGRIKIQTAEEALRSEHPHWPERQKLVTLFGRTDGDLEWRLHKHGDGSGGSLCIYPCTSAEDAREKAHLVVRELMEGGSYLADAVKSADALGVPVPMEVRSKVWHSRRFDITRNIRSAAETLENGRRALAALGEDPLSTVEVIQP